MLQGEGREAWAARCALRKQLKWLHSHEVVSPTASLATPAGTPRKERRCAISLQDTQQFSVSTREEHAMHSFSPQELSLVSFYRRANRKPSKTHRAFVVQSDCSDVMYLCPLVVPPKHFIS
jgi:hypothetical protein